MKMAGWMAVVVMSAAMMFAQTASTTTAPATTDSGTAGTHTMCKRDKDGMMAKDGTMAHCKGMKDGKMSKGMSKKCMCNHQKQESEKKS